MSELSENAIEVEYRDEEGRVERERLEISGLRIAVIDDFRQVPGGSDFTISLADLVALLNTPKPAKSPRLFSGCPPTWPCSGKIDAVEVDGVRWMVAVRDDYRKKPIWRDVKVYAGVPVPDKANYSLSWNTYLGVFADGDALKVMKAYRPELLAAVSVELLKVNWPK